MALIPFMRAPHSWPSHLPKAHFLIPSPWALGFNLNLGDIFKPQQYVMHFQNWAWANTFRAYLFIFINRTKITSAVNFLHCWEKEEVKNRITAFALGIHRQEWEIHLWATASHLRQCSCIKPISHHSPRLTQKSNKEPQKFNYNFQNNYYRTLTITVTVCTHWLKAKHWKNCAEHS